MNQSQIILMNKVDYLDKALISLNYKLILPYK